MTAERFEFREINEPPIFPKCYDTEKQEYANLFECVGWLNEQHETIQKLNQQLRIYRKVASCSNCKYHNYDWDIDDGYGGEEYEVCDKGNDVTEGICEDWREL